MKPVIIIVIGVIVVGIGVIFLSGSPPEHNASKIIPEQMPEGLTLEQYDKVLLEFGKCMADRKPYTVWEDGQQQSSTKYPSGDHCYTNRVLMIEEFQK